MTIINTYYIICTIVRCLGDTSQCRRCQYSNEINENSKEPRRRMINDSQWTIVAGNSKINWIQNNILSIILLYNCNCFRYVQTNSEWTY